MLVHLALYLLYLAVFLRLIFRWKFFSIEKANRKTLAVFFLLKVVAGIALTLIYTYYYTDTSNADIYRYFNDSKIISSLLFHHPIIWMKVMSGIQFFQSEISQYLIPTNYFNHPQTDIATNNTLIIRVASVFNYFSFYNIFIDTLFFNFFSFIGLTLLFKAFKKYFEEFQELLFVPVYLLPSLVFWSSGLLKESLAFTFLGAVFFLALNENKKQKNVRWILIALLLYFTYCVKPFAAVSVLVSLVLFSLNKIDFAKKKIFSAIVIAAFIVAFLIYERELFGSVCELLINKRNEFAALALAENAGSCFDCNFTPADCANLFSLIPKALLYAVFSPFVWERKNLFQFLFAAENTAFVLTIIFLLAKYFQKPAREKSVIAFSLFVFAFLNYLLIGITVPITGALVHYRIIASPFLLIGVLLLVNQQKLKARINSKL